MDNSRNSGVFMQEGFCMLDIIVVIVLVNMIAFPLIGL
jgi:hypothetical protein